MAWDVAEVESAENAADQVLRACIEERCRRASFRSNQCHQRSLVLNAVNSYAMRGATLKSRLGEMGVHISFSKPRFFNDNPY